MMFCYRWSVIIYLFSTSVKTQSLKEFGIKTLTSWGSHDVIGHVTIGLSVGTFLLVVNDDHASILHRYGDTGPQRFWDQNLDLWGSRDVIGHVTIGLSICGFLLVVHYNLALLRRYKASK